MNNEERQKAIEYYKETIKCNFDEETTYMAELAIQAFKKLSMLERMCDMYKQEGHAPTRTISMEELKELIR